MMSFLSFSFFKPAKAILVPGIYYEMDMSISIGRKHNTNIAAHLFGVFEVLEKSVLIPCDTLVDVGRGVREALRLTGLAAEQTAEKETRVLALLAAERAAEYGQSGIRGKLTREDLGRPCAHRLPREYGTARSAS